MERLFKKRLTILADYQNNNQCVCEETYMWLKMAEETLVNNHVNRIEFASAIYQMLEKGRAKENNIMLVGPYNCGKTFLIKPLKLIFDCFVTPSASTFNWQEIADKEVSNLS